MFEFMVTCVFIFVVLPILCQIGIIVLGAIVALITYIIEKLKA